MTFGWCSLEVMEDSDKSGFHGDNGMTNFMEVVQMRMESEENDKESPRPPTVSTICWKYS